MLAIYNKILWACLMGTDVVVEAALEQLLRVDAALQLQEFRRHRVGAPELLRRVVQSVRQEVAARRVRRLDAEHIGERAEHGATERDEKQPYESPARMSPRPTRRRHVR